MEQDPRRWIAALRSSHNDLVARARALSPQQLQTASYCSGWDVSQVLSHLGSGAEIALMRLEHVIDGRPEVDRAEFPPIWDRWNAMRPEQRVTEMVVWDRRLVALFDSLDDTTLASLHSTFFGMELDAVDMVAMRFGEHAVHSWDVAVSFDDTAELSPEAATLLVDRLAPLAARAGKGGALAGPKRAQLRVHHPDRHMLLSVAEKVALEPVAEGSDLDGQVDGTLTMPAAALVRLVYGRLDAEHTPADVVSYGDFDLDQLRQVFPGF